MKILKFIQSIILFKCCLWNCIICLQDFRVPGTTWELLHFSLFYFFKNIQSTFFFLFQTKYFLSLDILEHIQWKWSLPCIGGVYLYHLVTITSVWNTSSTFLRTGRAWPCLLTLLNFIATIVPCFFPFIILHTLFPQFPVIWKTFPSWELMASQSIKSERWHRCFFSGLYHRITEW